MSDKFRIGDRVVVVVDIVKDDNPDLTFGDAGTVVRFGSSGGAGKERSIGVDWDREINGGHACHGSADIGHGWYVNATDIEHEYQMNQDFDMSESEILTLLGGVV